MMFHHTGCRLHAASGTASGSKVGALGALLRRVLKLDRDQVRATDILWHEIDPPLWRSLKLIDGGRSQQTGRLWRRRTAAGAWEYRQDPETLDDFLDRQW